MFHIRRYRAIKGVSYDFTCNTFRRGHSYFFFFFFVMPLFSRMDVFSFILIHILKSF